MDSLFLPNVIVLLLLFKLDFIQSKDTRNWYPEAFTHH